MRHLLNYKLNYYISGTLKYKLPLFNDEMVDLETMLIFEHIHIFLFL